MLSLPYTLKKRNYFAVNSNDNKLGKYSTLLSIHKLEIVGEMFSVLIDAFVVNWSKEWKSRLVPLKLNKEGG